MGLFELCYCLDYVSMIDINFEFFGALFPYLRMGFEILHAEEYCSFVKNSKNTRLSRFVFLLVFNDVCMSASCGEIYDK